MEAAETLLETLVEKMTSTCKPVQTLCIRLDVVRPVEVGRDRQGFHLPEQFKEWRCRGCSPSPWCGILCHLWIVAITGASRQVAVERGCLLDSDAGEHVAAP